MKLPAYVFHVELADLKNRRRRIYEAYADDWKNDERTQKEQGAFDEAVGAVVELDAAKRKFDEEQQKPSPRTLKSLVEPVVTVVTTQVAKVWHQARAKVGDAPAPSESLAPDAAASPPTQSAAATRLANAQAMVADVATPSSDLGLAGLALSGGGIRSATFNLGVLQAFCKRGLFEQFDYLSTVSGGGYIGGTMSSLLWNKDIRPSDTDFPLRHTRGEEESLEIKHLRAGANYLAPRGVIDKVRIPALFLRGLIVNLALIMPWILLAVVGTELTSGRGLRSHVTNMHYAWALWMSGVLLLWIFLFGPIRGAISMNWKRRNLSEQLFGLWFLATAVVASLSALPWLVYKFHSFTSFKIDFIAGGGFGTIIAVGAPLLPLLLASGTPRPLNTWQGKLLVSLFGLMGPVLLFIVYVELATWRIFCVDGGTLEHCPRLWRSLAGSVSAFATTHPGLLNGLSSERVFDVLFVGIALALFIYGCYAVDLNLTSLHSFYRDRLSGAYLFCGIKRAPVTTAGPAIAGNDELRLSELCPNMSTAPYHLINATLNLQASSATQGRHADFFLFSKRFVGSAVTGYVETPLLERVDPRLDVGTAVAVSGAALAPNMGTSTNRGLTFLLTLLNVRTGYWLPNPRWLGTRFFTDNPRGSAIVLSALKGLAPIGLLAELFGLIDEKSLYVNLSDGGHVENLGLYELLRRRCRYIVVCDAEADPDMAFDGLAKVMRYARIDSGVEVELDVSQLRKDPNGLSRSHYAIGRIRYSEGSEGCLIYLKAALCGDESEDIRAYQARNKTFPHESTSQQFFNEGQFEAYRALGYHIANKVLDDAEVDDARFGKGMTMDRWIRNLERSNAVPTIAV